MIFNLNWCCCEVPFSCICNCKLVVWIEEAHEGHGKPTGGLEASYFDGQIFNDKTHTKIKSIFI